METVRGHRAYSATLPWAAGRCGIGRSKAAANGRPRTGQAMDAALYPAHRGGGPLVDLAGCVSGPAGGVTLLPGLVEGLLDLSEAIIGGVAGGFGLRPHGLGVGERPFGRLQPAPQFRELLSGRQARPWLAHHEPSRPGPRAVLAILIPATVIPREEILPGLSVLLRRDLGE